MKERIVLVSVVLAWVCNPAIAEQVRLAHRPAFSHDGTTKVFSFKPRQSCARAEKQRSVFDQCWQVMRDRFYDERHSDKDGDVVRAKYRDMAAESQDMKGVAECVWLMPGELIGSHLSLRFDPAFAGPGWMVRDVSPKGPASRKERSGAPGDIILKIDGKDVTPATDASAVLNGLTERDITLCVKSAAGSEHDLTLRPTTHTPPSPQPSPRGRGLE